MGEPHPLSPSPLPSNGEGGRGRGRSGPLSRWERVRVRVPAGARTKFFFRAPVPLPAAPAAPPPRDARTKFFFPPTRPTPRRARRSTPTGARTKFFFRPPVPLPAAPAAPPPPARPRNFFFRPRVPLPAAPAAPPPPMQRDTDGGQVRRTRSRSPSTARRSTPTGARTKFFFRPPVPLPDRARRSTPAGARREIFFLAHPSRILRRARNARPPSKGARGRLDRPGRKGLIRANYWNTAAGRARIFSRADIHPPAWEPAMQGYRALAALPASRLSAADIRRRSQSLTAAAERVLTNLRPRRHTPRAAKCRHRRPREARRLDPLRPKGPCRNYWNAAADSERSRRRVRGLGASGFTGRGRRRRPPLALVRRGGRRRRTPPTSARRRVEAAASDAAAAASAASAAADAAGRADEAAESAVRPGGRSRGVGGRRPGRRRRRRPPRSRPRMRPPPRPLQADASTRLPSRRRPPTAAEAAGEAVRRSAG